MGFSSLTNHTITTPYQSSRLGAKVTTIVLHHMDSTDFNGVLAMWHNATRSGSANYGISNEGEIWGVVDESLRAWSLGYKYDGGKGAAFDRHSICFEIENSSTNPPYPVSDAAHEAAARLVADICKRYGIVCNRTNVLGHREVYTRYGASYATACPGGLDMDRIVNRANQILTNAPASATLKPTEVLDMSYSIVHQNGSNNIWVVSLETGNYAGIQSPYHVQLLQRVKVNNGADPMNQIELDIVKAYLTAIHTTPTAPVEFPTLTSEQLTAVADQVAAKLPAAAPAKLNITLSGEASA